MLTIMLILTLGIPLVLLSVLFIATIGPWLLLAVIGYLVAGMFGAFLGLLATCICACLIIR